FASREMTLPLKIQTYRWLEGEVRPDPSSPNSSIRAVLYGSPALRVETVWPWGDTVSAVKRGDESWEARSRVPNDWQAGPTWMTARAYYPGGSRLERTVPFLI